MTLQPNSELNDGKYRIIETLGQGGFGITYLGEHTLMGRKVCIKEFFLKEYCDREEQTSEVSLGTSNNRAQMEKYQAKFVKEAKLISGLDHPNVIKIHDVFYENNTAYYVMEFIDGMNLNEMVRENGPLAESDALRYIKLVGEGLAYVHEKGINHLDVKPGNIMVRKSDNQPILIDFGMSKQYDEGGEQTSSTPIGVSAGYAPLEQYQIGGVSSFSPQTDVYALGATLYRLVTGKVPPSASDIMNDGLPEIPSSISLSTRRAIQKAMQFRKKERPANVTDFLKSLVDDQASAVPTMGPQPTAEENDVSTIILPEPQTILASGRTDNDTTIHPPVASANVDSPSKTPTSRPRTEPRPSNVSRVDYSRKPKVNESFDKPKTGWLVVCAIFFFAALLMFCLALANAAHTTPMTSFDPFGYIGGGLFAIAALVGFLCAGGSSNKGYFIAMAICSLLLGFLNFYDAIDEDNSWYSFSIYKMRDENTTSSATSRTITLKNSGYPFRLLSSVIIDGNEINSDESSSDPYFSTDETGNSITFHNLKPDTSYPIFLTFSDTKWYGLFSRFKNIVSIMDPQSVSTLEPEIASVTIESVNVDLDVYDNDGNLGMKAHIAFTVTGALGEDYRCCLFFYDADTGMALSDTNGSYCTTDGNVYVSGAFKPLYENTRYADFTLFLPYDELHCVHGTNLIATVSFVRTSDGKICDASYNYFFSFQ